MYNKKVLSNALKKLGSAKAPTKKQDTIYNPKDEGIILDLSPEEIEEYRKGGYIIEDISVPSLNHMDDGGEPCSEGFQKDPTTGECIRVQDVQEVPTNQYSKYIAAYEEANPREAYVYQKKADYLKKNKNLNRLAGLSQENFNTDVEGNFNSNWEYDRNSEVIKQFAKKYGINPKDHVELVEKMADKGDVSHDMIANSKYGSKLQPSLWARSLAGGQEFGNALVKGVRGTLTGEAGEDVFNRQTPGLTKKEWNDIHNSSTGALETLSGADVLGAAVANSVVDLSTASGGNYQESPGILSGELKSNVSPLQAGLVNPLAYTGLGEMNAGKSLLQLGKLKGAGLLEDASGLVSNIPKKVMGADYVSGVSKIKPGINKFSQNKILLDKSLVKTAGQLPESVVTQRVNSFTNPIKRKQTIETTDGLRKQLKEDLYRINKLKKENPGIDLNDPNLTGYNFNKGEIEKIPEYLKGIEQNKKSTKSFAKYFEKEYNDKMSLINKGDEVFQNIAKESPQYIDEIAAHLKNPTKSNEDFLNELVMQSNTYTRFQNNPVSSGLKGKSFGRKGYTMDVEGITPSDYYGSEGFRIEPTIDRAREIFNAPLAEKWSKRIPEFKSDMVLNTDGIHDSAHPDLINFMNKRRTRLDSKMGSQYGMLENGEILDNTNLHGLSDFETFGNNKNFRSDVVSAIPNNITESKYFRQPKHLVFESPTYDAPLENFNIYPMGKLQGKDYSRFFEGTGKGFKKGGAYYDDSRDAWVSADGKVGPNGPATYAYGGALHKFIGGGEPCPDGQMWDEATQSCVSANETTTEEVDFDPIDMWAKDYEQKSPRGSYVYDKKQEYIKKSNRGLNKLAGITLDNFPKEEEDRINEKYNYNMNSYITDRMAKVKKFNPKRRDEWIDELGPRSREVVANSKYGSKLQPSLWSRSLAGLATLASPFSPDLQAEVNASLPGLTKKESQEILNSNFKGIPLGGLEAFSAADIPGAVIANYLKNSKKDNPNIFSGELMSNVDAVDAMAMNPIGVIGGIEGLAALGTKGVSLLGLTADALKPGAKALDPTFIPEQTFKKEFSNIYNPKTKTYDVYEINVPQEAIPGRSYADVQHKIKNLRKDLNINPVENFIKKKFKTNAKISLDKDAGMVIDPETGKLFDSNTRYWLNREYGIFPKAPINKTQLAKSNGTLIKKGLTFDESEELLSKLNNSTTVTEPFEIAKKRIVNSSNNINRIIRKPDPVVKPNYGQQEFAFPTDAPMPSARLSNEEQMIEGMEQARLTNEQKSLASQQASALKTSAEVPKTYPIGNPDYYTYLLSQTKMPAADRKLYISMIEKVKEQGNIASDFQKIMLDRIKKGDFNYSGSKGNINAGLSPELIANTAGSKNVVGANLSNFMTDWGLPIGSMFNSAFDVGSPIGSLGNKALSKISPLNLIPSYGKKIEGATMSMGDILSSGVKNGKVSVPQSLFKQAKNIIKKSDDEILTVKNNKTNADIYTVKVDPTVKGSKVKNIFFN